MAGNRMVIIRDGLLGRCGQKNRHRVFKIFQQKNETVLISHAFRRLFQGLFGFSLSAFPETGEFSVSLQAL